MNENPLATKVSFSGKKKNRVVEDSSGKEESAESIISECIENDAQEVMKCKEYEKKIEACVRIMQ